jgi:cephalosporin hydroxylase
MIIVDAENSTVTVRGADGSERHLPMHTPQAFQVVTQAWLRVGWDAKYVYSFTWMGRPLIQLPDDMLRIQEVIYSLKPDVIIETGIAHGGSLMFYASLCKAMEKGRVIGIDIEIRPQNRTAIEAHELFPYIAIFEGSSIDPSVVGRVRDQIKPGETVFVMLDSNHTKQHVLEELRAYAPMVTVDSYIVVADGIMEDVVGAPRTSPDWSWNNPKAAVAEFLQEDCRFAIEEPAFPFNEGIVRERVTYWPSGYLRRIN